ncbi:MAG: hypothetical protein AAF636_18700 [Pseudomonadota bacterium]
MTKRSSKLLKIAVWLIKWALGASVSVLVPPMIDPETSNYPYRLIGTVAAVFGFSLSIDVQRSEGAAVRRRLNSIAFGAFLFSATLYYLMLWDTGNTVPSLAIDTTQLILYSISQVSMLWVFAIMVNQGGKWFLENAIDDDT